MSDLDDSFDGVMSYLIFHIEVSRNVTSIVEGLKLVLSNETYLGKVLSDSGLRDDMILILNLISRFIHRVEGCDDFNFRDMFDARVEDIGFVKAYSEVLRDLSLGLRYFIGSVDRVVQLLCNKDLQDDLHLLIVTFRRFRDDVGISFSDMVEVKA